MALLKCPECGHDVSSMASVCPNCGYPILSMNLKVPEYPEHAEPPEEQTPQNSAPDEFDLIDEKQEQQPKKTFVEKLTESKLGIALIYIITFAIISFVFFASSKTAKQNSEKSSDRSSSSYSTSSSSYSSGVSQYSAAEEYKILYLELEDTELKSSSYNLYTIVSGAVRNNGTRTCYFVKVRATFYDEDGKSIDVGDTYACGAEGIAPGESSKFEIYVDYDERIQTSRTKIYDCD